MCVAFPVKTIRWSKICWASKHQVNALALSQGLNFPPCSNHRRICVGPTPLSKYLLHLGNLSPFWDLCVHLASLCLGFQYRFTELKPLHWHLSRRDRWIIASDWPTWRLLCAAPLLPPPCTFALGCFQVLWNLNLPFIFSPFFPLPPPSLLFPSLPTPIYSPLTFSKGQAMFLGGFIFSNFSLLLVLYLLF